MICRPGKSTAPAATVDGDNARSESTAGKQVRTVDLRRRDQSKDLILHPCATWTDRDGVVESLSDSPSTFCILSLPSSSINLSHSPSLSTFVFSLSPSPPSSFHILPLSPPSLTLLSLSLYCLNFFLSFALSFSHSLSQFLYAYKRALIQSLHRARLRPLRRETPIHRSHMSSTSPILGPIQRPRSTPLGRFLSRSPPQ